MKKFIIVSKCLILFLFLVILCINIYIILEQLVLRNVAPRFFGYSFVIQDSNDLEPEINSGDLVVIKSVDSYSEGDMITYIKNDNLVTAKITKIDDTIVTVCDLKNGNTEITITGYIVGKVVKSISGLGSFCLWIKNPFWIVVLLIGTLVVLELPYFICSILKKRKSRSKKFKVLVR